MYRADGSIQASAEVMQPVVDFVHTLRGRAVSFDFYSHDPYRKYLGLFCGTGDGLNPVFSAPLLDANEAALTPVVKVAGTAKTRGPTSSSARRTASGALSGWTPRQQRTF